MTVERDRCHEITLFAHETGNAEALAPKNERHGTTKILFVIGLAPHIGSVDPNASLFSSSTVQARLDTLAMAR